MRDILEKFREIQEKEGEDFFINNCNLLPGTYIKIYKDKPIQEEDVFVYTNKTDIIAEADKYDWFRKRLFYNMMINMDQNKGISQCGKQFSSVTPYSLCFRYVIYSKHNEAKINNFINGYFNELSNKYSFDQSKVEEFSELFINKLREVKEMFKEVSEGERILLMLDVDVSEYKESYELYLKERICLGEKTYLDIDGERYGVTQFSTTLDSNKPILSSNTVRQFHYVLSIEDLILLNNIVKVTPLINDVLNNSDQTYDIVFDGGSISNYEIYAKNNKEYIFYKHSILSSEEPNEIPETPHKTHKEVGEYIDGVIANGIIGRATSRNLSTQKDISDYYKFADRLYSDNRIPQKVVTNKNCFKEYFEKNSEIEIGKDLEALLKMIYEYKLNHDYKYTDLRLIFDAIVNVMAYVTNKERYKNMAKNIKEIRENLKEARNLEVLEIKSDEEFYYLSGQVLQYLSSLSKSKDKTYRDINDYNKVKKASEIKNKMIDKYDQYSHSISMYSLAFINLAYQAIMVYNIEGKKIDKLKGSELWYYYHAGLVGNNIFFEKKTITPKNSNDTDETLN